MDGLESGKIVGHGDVRQVIYGDNEANHYEWSFFGQKDAAESERQGHQVFKQYLLCKIHLPGGKTVHAKQFRDENDAELPEFFARHPKAHRIFQLFRTGAERPMDGTPIDLWPYMDEGQKEEFKAQRIYTVEQIAALPDMTLQTLGPAARGIRTKAQQFLENAKNAVAAEENAKLKAEMAELRAMLLEQKENSTKAKRGRPRNEEKADDETEN